MRFWMLSAAIGMAAMAVVAPAFANPVTLTLVGVTPAADTEWTVTRIDKHNKLSSTPTAQASAPTFSGDLAPGQYIVHVSADGESTDQAIIVGSGKTERKIYMHRIDSPSPSSAASAHITMQLLPFSGGSMVREPLEWQVYPYVKGALGDGPLITASHAAVAHFDLPAGAYIVRALYQGTRADLVIPLNSGETFHYTVNLYAGMAHLRSTGKSAAVSWAIARATTNAEGKHELVNEASGSDLTMTLREGDYIALARDGKKWGMQTFSIRAGKTAAITVPMEKAGSPTVAFVPPATKVAQSGN
jgi:hypothetical protein